MEWPFRHLGGDAPLSLAQMMILQGLIPIVFVGFFLPIGLVAAALAIESAPVRSAVDHGELFLAGANAGFIGSLTLVASRTDQTVNSMITAILVLIVVIFPGYFAWALLSVQALMGKGYSDVWPLHVGGTWAVVGVLVGLALVKLSYRPPATR
jgi:hypothetical protein